MRRWIAVALVLAVIYDEGDYVSAFSPKMDSETTETDYHVKIRLIYSEKDSGEDSSDSSVDQNSASTSDFTPSESSATLIDALSIRDDKTYQPSTSRPQENGSWEIPEKPVPISIAFGRGLPGNMIPKSPNIAIGRPQNAATLQAAEREFPRRFANKFHN